MQIKRIFESLKQAKKGSEFYYNYLNPSTNKWCIKHATIGALSDSFYEYLLKLWLYNGKSDDELLEVYLEAINGLNKNLLVVSPNNLTYFGEINSQRIIKKMDHLACFSGGLLGLTSITVDKLDANEKENFLYNAKQITNTCHESYIRTPTHLGPESFHFERTESEAMAIKNEERYYILRPEVISSFSYTIFNK